MPIVLLILALVTSFPSNSKTSWMTPQSFRLVIGMPRAEALKTLHDAGWVAKHAKSNDELVVDYSEDKALTLDFNRDRLRSIRFELFAIIPEVRAAFDEQKSALKKEHANPKKLQSPSVIVYDDRLPNIMVVLSDDPKSDYGKRGVGYLAVRYYDPAMP